MSKAHQLLAVPDFPCLACLTVEHLKTIAYNRSLFLALTEEKSEGGIVNHIVEQMAIGKILIGQSRACFNIGKHSERSAVDYKQMLCNNFFVEFGIREIVILRTGDKPDLYIKTAESISNRFCCPPGTKHRADLWQGLSKGMTDSRKPLVSVL